MNLSFLRYFLAVVETRGFGRAAERCNVTQPTLSAGIARLEQEIGARLFDRDTPIALTGAGLQFLPHARTMLDEWQQARSVTRAEPTRPRLRLAVAATLPSDAVGRLVAQGRQRGSVEFEIVEGRAAAMRERIARGIADIAITVLADDMRTPNGSVLFREPYMIAVADGHALAARDRCGVGDLADVPFIIRPHCEMHAGAARAFADRGIRPRVAMRAASDESAVAAARAGLGAVLLPRSLARPGLTPLALRDLKLERRVGLLWRADIDATLLDTLRRLAASHPWPGQPSREERIVLAH